MARYNRAMSEEQIVDLQWAIMKWTDAVGTYMVDGDIRAAVNAVEHLETLLYSFVDKQYEDDIEAMNSGKNVRANTDSARRAIAKQNTVKRVRQKHRALMSLAMRCGFMPLKKTGSSGAGR